VITRETVEEILYGADSPVAVPAGEGGVARAVEAEVVDGARAENFIRAGESHNARRSRGSGFVALKRHESSLGEAVVTA
jgi:hypothetical protein